jgi:hypothetical protein
MSVDKKTGKRVVNVVIVPECLEKLKRGESESIELADAVVNISYQGDRSKIDFPHAGNGCFVDLSR